MRKFNMGRSNGQPQMFPSPASGKISQVAQEFGNPSLSGQQGTTYQFYDSLLLNGESTMLFFQGAGRRDFPLTNANEGNGMLTVGEAMVIQTAQICFVELNPSTGAVVSISNLGSNLQFQQGEISIMQGNQQVLKRMKLQTWVEQFNENAMVPEYNVFHFKSLLTIMPLIPVVVQVRLPAGVTVANTYAQIILDGMGGILSPKVNF